VTTRRDIFSPLSLSSSVEAQNNRENAECF
jgi:hypothetical protein